MEQITNDASVIDKQIDDEKQDNERYSSVKYHNDIDNDEGATWSISSNGGISRSSHDDGLTFQSKLFS